MKKLLLLFVLTTLTISCTSKSDKLIPPSKNSENEEFIIGTWKLIQINGENITDTCQNKDTYTFNENGSYTFDDYNMKDSSCAKDDSKSFKGTWKNNNNNTYNIKKDEYTGNGADININFSDDKQELTFLNTALTYKKQS